MVDYTKPIAESNNFIVLDKYTKEARGADSYQSEYDLESNLIADLMNQGYEYLPDLNTPEAMLANVRVQLQALNNVQFMDGEWLRFVETYLDKPSDSIVDKTRKIHDDYIHDFIFDDGHIQNIYLVDKKNIARNKVQVIRQFEQTGTHANRYDVTILVNGLPLVHVELKKRGVAIREAFNQVHRYSKESFNSEHSLFKYIQMFVISNGTDSRYFANTTQRNKHMVADMDFLSPPAVLEALRERIDHGIFGYTLAPASLVEAVQNHVQQQYGWQIEPEWLV